MDLNIFNRIETHMRLYANDGAHDSQHVYRVLYCALEIARSYETDADVLAAACLLHDIGRAEQFKNPDVDHAEAGARMAYDFLVSMSFDAGKAAHIYECIATHRFRNGKIPRTIEAKILFDADKLDSAGLLGIARTLAYKGIVSEPIYSVDKSGAPLPLESDSTPSFFNEYNFKLKNIHGRLFTARAKEIAVERAKAAEAFYSGLLREINETYKSGAGGISRLLRA